MVSFKLSLEFIEIYYILERLLSDEMMKIICK